MNRLEIETRHTVAVELLLVTEDLSEQRNITVAGNAMLWIAYPDDSLSQSFRYWLAMAQGCGLIDRWEWWERQ